MLPKLNVDPKPYSICLESFGVRVRLESASARLLNDAKIQAKHALAGNLEFFEVGEVGHVFRLDREGTDYFQTRKGEKVRFGKNRQFFLRYFDSCLRLTIAEYAVGCVFVHAGVVGWKGRAIVLPGDSFSGKTTLVAELVRKGADYYSDEYAVFDEEGFVHPFARRLGVRSRPPKGEVIDMTYLTAEAIGGTPGTLPLPVGCVLITSFEEQAKWDPQFITSGQTIMEMLSQTIPIRYAPEFSLKVLKKVATNAIIIKSPRFDAQAFAELFLDFIDNRAF